MLLDDPTKAIKAAHVVFDSEDGDAWVALLAQPYNANWPTVGQLHHFDAQTQQWSVVYSGTGYISKMSLRELEPGQMMLSPSFVDLPDVSYFVTEELGLGEPVSVSFPDYYADGVMYRAWVDKLASEVNYQVYSQDDPVGTLDTLDILEPGTEIDPFYGRPSPVLIRGGRAYAMWTHIEIAIHDGDGWGEPIVFGKHSHPMAPMRLVASSDDDVLATWTPRCPGSVPCADDPGMLARYDAIAECWYVTELDGLPWDPWLLPFPGTSSVAMTSVGPFSARGRIVSW